MFDIEMTEKSLDGKSHAPTKEELAAINDLARTALAEDEVYTFVIRAADTRVDRDYERFSPDSIKKLAQLYLGKTVIFDHAWTALNQTARVFAAEAAAEEDGALSLRLSCYMLREGNEKIVAAIEGGILKEVSVGCAVARTVCSICGENYAACEHQKGRTYDGVLCVAILEDPTDAYEVSFVAVPAQREAGVQKDMHRENMSTHELESAKMRLQLEKIRF